MAGNRFIGGGLRAERERAAMACALKTFPFYYVALPSSALTASGGQTGNCMQSKERLIELNTRQKEFYESKAQAGRDRNPSLNLPSYLWVRLRQMLQKSERDSGVGDAIIRQHRAWLGDLSDKDVLDLGCFAGNRLSLELAQSARSYLGIDLSANAINKLRKKIDGIPTAEVRATDFLAEGFRDRFDVIYAHGVLHHFDDFELLCSELKQALRPGGVVIALDPLQTDPVNRLIRMAYRPFQSDKDWEWPFDRSNFATMEKHFSIEAVQGFRGFSRLAMFAGPWSANLAKWGCNKDLKYANRFGPALTFCWVVATKLRK